MSASGNAEQLARTLGKAKPVGQQWIAQCPAHDDQNPSLTIADGEDGKLLVHCQAHCSQDQVIAALRSRGLWPDPASLRPRGAAKPNGAAGKPNSPLTKSMDAPSAQQRNPAGRRCNSFVRRGVQAQFNVTSRGPSRILSTAC